MKIDPQLPFFDPEYLTEEDDPEKLHAYVQGLLLHLRDVRAGGKAHGYPIAAVKLEACLLIDAYANAHAAPCPELGELVRELLNPNPQAKPLPVHAESEAAYRAAIAFEALTPGATLYAVAKHLRDHNLHRGKQKTVEGMVRGWRNIPHYKANSGG